MVISDDIQPLRARITLAAHIFIGQNQRTIMPRLILARIRDRVNLHDLLDTVFAALRLAHTLKREAVVVTILCDGGEKYLSENFWEENG